MPHLWSLEPALSQVGHGDSCRFNCASFRWPHNIFTSIPTVKLTSSQRWLRQHINFLLNHVFRMKQRHRCLLIPNLACWYSTENVYKSMHFNLRDRGGIMHPCVLSLAFLYTRLGHGPVFQFWPNMPCSRLAAHQQPTDSRTPRKTYTDVRWHVM
jgi:hypothetical protein